MSKCKGCGATLQSADKNKMGYTPKEGSDFCQRCFRLNNYGDLTFSAKQEVNSMDVLIKVSRMNALVLWIVDLFDLETALQESINRYLHDHDIIMVATKRDLLPDSIGTEKLSKYLMMRLKEKDIFVKGLVVIGDYGNDGKEEIIKALQLYRKNRDVAVIGTTNAGKSTMLKAVFAVDSLTISRYPGTTLDFIAIQQPEFIIYDTPGFNRNNSAQILLDDADLKLIVPQHRIKPVVYQLSGNQTLSIGGLMRVDLIGCLTTSCVCYFSDKLLIHRSKTENAEQLWNEHYGELLVPIIKDKWDKHLRKLTLLNEKFDIAIFGLGWICINGPISEVHVSGCKEIDVIVRKAMI